MQLSKALGGLILASTAAVLVGCGASAESVAGDMCDLAENADSMSRQEIQAAATKAQADADEAGISEAQVAEVIQEKCPDAGSQIQSAMMGL